MLFEWPFAVDRPDFVERMLNVMKGWLAKINTKILLMVMLGVGVAGGAVVLSFSQHNQKPPVENAQGTQIQSPSSLDVLETVQAAPKRKTYPVGKWNTDIPYLNPFGSQGNYQSVEFAANKYAKLSYITKDNRETSRDTAGNEWKLTVSWKDPALDPFADLLQYVSELGGEYFRGPGEDSWVFHAMDSDGNDWWGTAAKKNGGYLLTVYQELRLRAGETVVFHTKDYKNQVVYFMTENDGHRYQSIQAAMNKGEAQIVGKGAYSQGQYARQLSYVKYLYAYKTEHYALDDIPQDTSTPILWEVNWRKGTEPKEISLTLDELEEITPLADGERLGALKVHGVPMGHVTVKAPSGITVRHPELSLKGNLTPEGDILFWLPSGYWNVVIQPGSDKAYTSDLNARLIPVRTGEMTTLDIDPVVNRSYLNKEMGKTNGSESELSITDLSEDGDRVKISFMLLDSESPRFTPTLSNTQIREGGQEGKIVKLDRLQTPPSIVLALDSSGSMADSMDQVLEAARGFIQGLPDRTHIQVIDFDSKIRLLEGTGKDEVLQSLSQVKAEGATTLYDSIVQGLDLLKGLERPTLLIFTDGVDSSTEGNGSGSKATKQEVGKAVADAGIPVFTIGFSEGHDAATLLELAGMSEGTYYSAMDAEAVQRVFASINERLGNHFEVVYERPREAVPSDVPVIALTMDVSGSMDINPSSGNGDYRLDKVKKLYHEFIKKIPDDSLMQLMSFSANVTVEQVFTKRKTEIIQALGQLAAEGGTNIIDSAERTLRSLRAIPSSKRVIVYLTDAALDVDASRKADFEKILTGIKEEGIVSLWVGLGTEKAEAAFKWAAEKSGGKYIISEDPGMLAKALQDALDSMQAKEPDKVAVTFSINNDEVEGKARQYTVNQLTNFHALQSSTEKVALNTISYRTGTPIAQYEAATASLLYGRDLPGTDVKIYKRLPLNVKGKNKAVEWKAKDLFFLKSLGGVTAPDRKSFMAVDVEMKNIHPEGATYLIPDFASHFFIDMNQSGAYPASTATWLAESPLVPPGKSELAIKRDETVRGVLVFLVADEDTERASLNFYDTENGHIALSLIGEAGKMGDLPLASLPKTVTGKLSDTFSMTLTANGDMNTIHRVSSSEKSVFKVIEARLNSNVQTLLNVNPQERFFLKVGTTNGPFLIPVNTTTALLPYGFLRPVAIGPGTSNTVRLAFQTPNVLKDSPMELYGDLRDGAMLLPVRSEAVDHAGSGSSYQGDGVSMTVNALARVKSIEKKSSDYVIADITFSDTKDGAGVSGFRQSFTLTSGNADSGQERSELRPDPVTDDLLLGIANDWPVFDGTSRRGLLVFNIPSKQAGGNWVLQSSLFGDLHLAVGQGNYAEEGLLVKQVSPDVDKKFDNQLAEALIRVINQYKAVSAMNTAPNTMPKDDLDAGKQTKNNIPAPLPTLYGLAQLKTVKTWADFQTVIGKLQWLPSLKNSWSSYRYSPESVLTQGWGTEGDLAHLTGGMLANLGYSPALRVVTVTNKGREALKKLGNVAEAKTASLPAWAYTGEQGTSKLFVVPFMKDLSELSGLVYLPGGQEVRSLTAESGVVKVYFKVKAKGNKNVGSAAGVVSDALAGDTGTSGPDIQEILMLDSKLPMDQLGNEAVDIRIGGKNGLYTAVLENQTIQIVGNGSVNLSKFNIASVRLEVQLPDKKLVHETALQEGEDSTGVFHTLTVNLPDLSAEATASLQQAADRVYRSAVRPDVQSTLAWYTRNILYRFVVNQTTYEKQLAETLDVTAGRTEQSRVLVVTVRRKDSASPLRTSIDLMQSANQLHRGVPEAVRAFNIASGLYASRLEGTVLPGDKADFVEVWSRSPEDTKLFISVTDNRKGDLSYMKQQGYPDFLIRRVTDSKKAMLIPNKPTRIYGEDRWIWLEVDPMTFETIAVMDTGEHGGMAEYLMALEPVAPTGDDYLGFLAGAFIGIDSSVWSVSAFSLIMDDYNQIVQAAKAYTAAIGTFLSDMMSNKDLAKLEYSMSPLKVKLSDANFDHLAKYFEEVQLGKEVKLGGDLVGFGLGFNSGAAYYFKQLEVKK